MIDFDFFKVSPSNWKYKRVLVLSPTPTHPQNFGNRKRVFTVCNELKQRGADVDFALYPVEEDWRAAVPRVSEREMRGYWNDLFIIPPTVPFHAPPSGSYHTVDAWWDPAIGEFLRWIFHNRVYDVFIVNYTWLSKALEVAPKRTLKILDTHDRFSGRKELLQSMNIEPEFFYLEDPQSEAVALDRADIVWAIKDQEAEFFRTITKRSILTVAHVDAKPPIEPPPPNPDGYLRVGVLGAANNINLVNITRFIQIGSDVWSRAFAPVKLVVAGSICKILVTSGNPYVELLGSIDDVDDFYSAVDVVVIPMEASTGLKIKTGEALSSGAAVISTKHAFEGFRVTHRMQQLPNLEAIAEEVVALSFAPERIKSLRVSARHSYIETRMQIGASLEATLGDETLKKGSIVHIVDAAAFDEYSLYGSATRSAREFFNYISLCDQYVVSGVLRPSLALEAYLDKNGRLFVAPEVDISNMPLSTRTQLVEIATLTEAAQVLSARMVVFDAIPPAENGDFRALHQLFRLSPIAARFGDAAAFTAAARLRTCDIAALGDDPSLRRMAKQSGGEYWNWPAMVQYCLPRLPTVSVTVKRRRDIVLLRDGSGPFSEALLELLRQKRQGVTIVDVAAEGGSEIASTDDVGNVMGTAAFEQELLSGSALMPRIVIDCAPKAHEFDLLREYLGRNLISVIHPKYYQASEYEEYNAVVRDYWPRGLLETFEIIMSVIEAKVDLAVRGRTRLLGHDFSGDAGWAKLWRLCNAAIAGVEESEINNLEFVI